MITHWTYFKKFNSKLDTDTVYQLCNLNTLRTKHWMKRKLD